MSSFAEYSKKYQTIVMERREGILQLTLHTNGGSLRLNENLPFEEIPQAFGDINADSENRVIIMTGTGEEFSGPKATSGSWVRDLTPAKWDLLWRQGQRLVMGLLDLELPIIAAVNGPAPRRADLPLLCDVVLAAEEATFQDSNHFIAGRVPGDGAHVVFPLLLGWNRARYFLLTGQELTARKALELGLVAEVLPRKDLLPRAWELAQAMTKNSPMTLRYTRLLFTQAIKRQMHDLLGYGLMVEGMAELDRCHAGD